MRSLLVTLLVVGLLAAASVCYTNDPCDNDFGTTVTFTKVGNTWVTTNTATTTGFPLPWPTPVKPQDRKPHWQDGSYVTYSNKGTTVVVTITQLN